MQDTRRRRERLLPRHCKSNTLHRANAEVPQASGRVSLPDLFVERLEYDPSQEEVPTRLVNAAYWLAEEFAHVPPERPSTRCACHPSANIVLAET